MLRVARVAIVNSSPDTSSPRAGSCCSFGCYLYISQRRDKNTNLDKGAASKQAFLHHRRQLNSKLGADKTVDDEVDGAVENYKEPSNEVEDVSQL